MVRYKFSDFDGFLHIKTCLSETWEMIKPLHSFLQKPDIQYKVFRVSGVAAVGAGVAMSAGLGLSNKAQNDILLANIQALAKSEDDVWHFLRM